jgi:hypothetical protein
MLMNIVHMPRVSTIIFVLLLYYVDAVMHLKLPIFMYCTYTHSPVEARRACSQYSGKRVTDLRGSVVIDHTS